MPEAMINGYKHHWEEAGSGDVLVMVHGANGASRAFAPQVQELSKSLRVLAIDLRGMGGSARIESINASGWVDDIGGLLDHLGIETASIFGTSLGSRIALRYAINNPERVQCLILDNPLVANESAGNAALNASMTDVGSLPQAMKDRYLAMHGEDWEDVVRSFFRIRNDAAVQEYLNVRGRCTGLPTPTLLTRSDNRNDPIHPLAHTIELFESLPNSRLWIKPAGGCFATPEGYDMVRNFITENARQPAPA